MLKLSISGKAATGACTNQLTINGPTARDPPVLCGTITGQHSKLVLNGKHQKHSKPAFLTFLGDQGVYGTFGLKIPNKNFATCRTGEILSHGQKIRENMQFRIFARNNCNVKTPLMRIWDMKIQSFDNI